MMDMGKALQVKDTQQIAVVDRGDVDLQVSTAKTYPRSIAGCLQSAIGLATYSREMAEACIYLIPRGGKEITGPSIRLAEIMALSWGNLRCKGRVIGEDGDFIVARGTAWDMETNVLFSADVRRRIIDKHGRRFSADMVGVTGNAAVSIAIRNVLLRVIPKAIIDQVYAKAKDTAVGSIRTIGERRSLALQKLAVFGITEERVLNRVGREGIEDVTLKDIEKLIGLYNAIDSENKTPDDAFPEIKIDIDPKPAAKKEEPKKRVTVEKTGQDNTSDGLDMTLGAIQERARADLVPEEMLKEFRIELGVVEDDKRTHTHERLAKLQKKIVRFIG